jgi:hypothetical protein
LILYWPELVRPHTKISFSSFSCTFMRRCTNCNQSVHLFAESVLLKDMFKGLRLKTFATETCFCYTMLYREGYCCDRGLFPNHVSSQNLVPIPFPTLKEPLIKNSSFTFINSFQKRWVIRFHCYFGLRLRMQIFVF